MDGLQDKTKRKICICTLLVEKYNGVINFSHTEIDSLQSELLDYQMLSDSFLPEDVGKDVFQLDSVGAF